MEELIQQFIPQLGFSVVFIYFLKLLWGYLRQKDEVIKAKDVLLSEREVNADVRRKELLDAYVSNTRVQEQLKSAIKENTEVLKANKLMTEKVHEILLRQG